MHVEIKFSSLFQPGECICHTGWSGSDCNQCIPYWACPEQGPNSCIEPNDCICFETTNNFICNHTRTWGLPGIIH